MYSTKYVVMNTRIDGNDIDVSCMAYTDCTGAHILGSAITGVGRCMPGSKYSWYSST